MIKDYIMADLSEKKEFRFEKSSFSVFNIQYEDADIKFDTGCGYSKIPLQRFASKSYTYKEKEKDVENLIKNIQFHMDNGYNLNEAKKLEYKKSYTLSYGIESGGKKHKFIDFLNKKDLMQAEEISFRHRISRFTIRNLMCELDMPDTDIFINFDRKGNVLLGMDVIESWDVHISRSARTNKNRLLACPLNKINDAYIRAFDEEFPTAQRESLLSESEWNR